MEELTVPELEDLIVLTESKLANMRPSDEGFQAEKDLIDKLRGIRQEKLYGTTEA